MSDASRREWRFYLIVEHVPAVEAISNPSALDCVI